METGSGSLSFALEPGRRRLVAGLVAGRDLYTVSYGAPNFGDQARCRQMAALSRGCQRKIVDHDYND